MAVQVGSAYGKIGLGTGDFTAGVGIVLTSLDILEARFQKTGTTLDSAFGTPLKEIPTSLNQLAAGATGTAAAFDKAVTPIREYTTTTAALDERIGSLSEKIGFQKRQLELLDTALLKTLKSKKATTEQIERKQLAFDRLAASIKTNEQRLENYQEELENSTKKVGLFTRALDQLENVGKKAGNTLNSLGGSARRALEFAAGNLIADGLQAIGEKVRDVGVAMIESNTQFQVYEGQFAVLLGSVEEATARLEELEEFGRTTPFELPEVINASRQLEVLTKGALSTGEGLRFVGDVAAGVNQPLENVSMWIGRAYDAMQSGRPFGEAAMRLQEMGALSGEARNRLEDLQKQGADGSVVWKAFTDDLSRFDGQMDVLSGTFAGVRSNLADTFNKTIRIVGAESFGVLEDAAKRALKAIDDNQEEIVAFAEELGSGIADAVGAGVELVEGVDWKLLGELITSAAEKAGDLAQFLVEASRLLGEISGDEAGDAAAQLFTLSEAYYAAIKAMAQTNAPAAAAASLSVLTGNLEGADRLIRLMPDAQAAFNAELIKTGHAVGSIPLDQFQEQLVAAQETIESVAPPLVTLEERLTKLFNRVQEMANADSPLEAIFAPEVLGRFADQLEQRADAFEEYSEKSREIAKRIVEEQRNYRDEVVATLGELREAQEEYTADVAEKGRQLRATLSQLDKEYGESLKELYAERRALDEEYNAERQTLSEEAAAELKANEEEFNREVAEIRAERIAAEQELQAALLEAETAYQDERAELEREHAEKVRETTRDLGRVHEDYTRDRGYRHQDHIDKMDDLEEKHAAKVLDLNKDMRDAEKDLADSRRDINKDLQDDLDDLEEDRVKSLGDIQKEIDEILSQAGGIGVDLFKKGKIGASGLSGISKDQKEELQELLDELEAEKKAYDEQAQDLKDAAQEKLDEEQRQHDERITDLQDRLDKEQELYDDATAKELERFRREEEAKDLAYSRAVEKLEERLTSENEAYDRQLGEIIGKHQAELDDLNTKYALANESLNTRFATALTSYDTQREAINTKLNDELGDLQTQHDAAIAQLTDRFTKELTQYEEKRGALITKHQEELTDLRASYDDRVTLVGEKLEEMKVKHQDAQADLKDQIRQTKDAYADELQQIADEFTKPATAMERLEESLTRIRGQIAQPFEIKFNVTGLPEEMVPSSPSPLEQSFSRTIKLMEGISDTPVVFDVQQQNTLSGAMQSVKKGEAGNLATIGTLLNVEQLNVGDMGEVRDMAKKLGETMEAKFIEFVEDLIERTHQLEAGGFAEVTGDRV